MVKNTVRGRMITQVPVVRPEFTVAELEQLLLQHTKDFETINYVYITDTADKLVGVVSIKEVFRSPKQTVLLDIMHTEAITVQPQVSQEQAVILALQHNLKALPVVDTIGKFIGVVPSDVLLQILHDEHIEDTLLGVGLVVQGQQARDIIKISTWSYFKKRLPWLIVGLAGGMAAAFIVNKFEGVLQKMLVLASFMPAVVYLADATGTQTETVFIRSLAVINNMGVKKYVQREILVGLGLAACLGIMAGVFGLWHGQSWLLGIILSVSFFTAIVVAVSVALLLPWLFSKFRIDPALASGPLATVICDILSIVVYFGVASIAIFGL